MNTDRVDLGVCEECGVEPANAVVTRTYTTDDERSNGPAVRSKNVCYECAWVLFESGEWETDSNE